MVFNIENIWNVTEIVCTILYINDDNSNLNRVINEQYQPLTHIKIKINLIC